MQNLFPNIWAGLTADGIAALLPDLEPKVKDRHVNIICPGCGQREAYIYEPKQGKGPSLHCNRRNNCSFDQSLFDFLRERHGGDGSAALSALAATAGVRIPECSAGDVVRSVRRPSAVKPQPRSGFGPSLRRVELIRTEPAQTPPQGTSADDKGALGIAEKQAAYRATLETMPPESLPVMFLLSRGITQAEAVRMNFGFCEDGLLHGRLTYPLTNRATEVVAIEGRSLADGNGPKCLCSGDKRDGVFNPTPRLSFDTLHLCEGPFDAAALSLIGVDTVATCGSQNLPEWLRRACCFKSIVAAQDADTAGDKAAQDLAGKLSGSTIRRLRPPLEGADWGDYLVKGRAVLTDAFWQASGVSNEIRSRRAEFLKLITQIDFLRQHERTAIRDRQTLLGLLSNGIDAFAAKCDLPGGYSDPSDPFADGALDILRQEEAQLRC